MKNIELEIPTLILGGGIAGSGKTTFFKELVKRVSDSFILYKDTINDAFLTTLSGPTIQRGSDYYHKYVKFQSYQTMLELARDNLALGKHPLLEGNYTKEICSDKLDDMVLPFFEEIHYKMKLIFCYADEEVIKARISKRGLDRDIDKLKDWQGFLREQPILPQELKKYNHVKIDTDIPLEDNIRKAMGYLKE